MPWRAHSLFAALVFALLPAAMATHPPNDAGTGQDAPDTWEAAWPIAPGAHHGYTCETYSPDSHTGYDDDWYRVAIPKGKAILATLSGHESALELRGDAGAVWGAAEGPEVQLPAQGAPGVRIGVLSGGTCSEPYVLELSLYDPPPQDDASTGYDAPTGWIEALEVPPSSYAGGLDPPNGDYVDWYRLAIPDGQYLKVTPSGLVKWSCLRHTGDGSIGSRLAYGQSVFLDGSYLFDEVNAVRLGFRCGSLENDTYQFSTELRPLTPQNDAATGADVPDRCADAATVGLGAHEGTAIREEADAADWYRFEIPEDKVLRVTGASWPWLEDCVSYWKPWSQGGLGTFFRGIDSSGAWETTGLAEVRSALYGSRVYRFTAEVLERADVAVEGVEVGPEAFPGSPRTVSVTVTNVGAADAYDTRVNVWSSPGEGGRTRDIARVVIDALEPGESRVIVAEWDTAGQIGYQTIGATATTWGDFNEENANKSTGAFVATPISGIDLLNQRFGSQTTAGVNHDLDGTFVFLRHSAGWPTCRHVEAGVDGEGEVYWTSGGPGLSISDGSWTPRCYMPPAPP